ncbi:MAG: exodeoxyribonuclease VII large subunit [Pseudomonadota bacterium]|nr:exodeoxyribonuclease VII large subunit [Pseudomonadota bacterium]
MRFPPCLNLDLLVLNNDDLFVNDNNEHAVLSVSDLNREARITIEDHFREVWVLGEMSNFARPRSGHWYFTLKDEKAQVRCAMFANRNRMTQMQPGDGQLVLLRGRVSLYEGRGEFQVIVDYMEAAGEGALRQAFDKLKDKLAAEGLFAEANKRPLPQFPEHAAILTSETGAAFRDIRAVLQRRYPSLNLTLIPCLVQGDQAEADLLRALSAGLTLKPDVIVLTRGGGSLEDLWSFNSETLARAIYASTIPIVSAVGHEIDFTIADFVADVRAPTPSAAAELISPDAAELLSEFADFEQHLTTMFRHYLEHQHLRVENSLLQIADPQAALETYLEKVSGFQQRTQRALKARITHLALQAHGLAQRLGSIGPRARIKTQHENLVVKISRMKLTLEQHLEQQREHVGQQARMLHNLSPLPTIDRGYGLVTNEDGRVVSSRAEVSSGDTLTTYVQDGSIRSVVDDTNPKTLTDSTG